MQTSDIALDFDFQLAFEQFNLNVCLQAGAELVVMFGPSGSGKSLTLRALAGLVRPDAGHIRVANQSWFDSGQDLCLPPQERRVGYVPQSYALFPHLSVADNVAFGLHRLPRSHARTRVRQILEVMRLDDQATSRPGALSGGQQQRVALARALVTEPQLLLMDEPLGALDAGLREHLRHELRVVQGRFQIPTLLITHDLAEAYSLAQQLAILERGRIVQTGPRDEVFRRPATPAVARVLGMSNILRGRVVEKGRQGLLVAWAGAVIRLPAGERSPGESITFGIRPEEVMFVRADRPLRPTVAENVVRGRIIADEAQGFDHNLTVAIDLPGDVEPISLRVRLPHPVFLRLGLATGQRHTLALKPDAIHLFP